MAQQVAGYAYWISALVAQSGHPVREELPKEKRRLFRELARLLLANDFDDLVQLDRGQDPSKWIGAGTFGHEDLDNIRQLISHRLLIAVLFSQVVVRCVVVQEWATAWFSAVELAQKRTLPVQQACGWCIYMCCTCLVVMSLAGHK